MCPCEPLCVCVCGITHTSASAKECVLLCLCVCVPVPQYQILLSQLSASLSLVVICLSVCCSTFNLFFSFTLLLSCECIICSPALSLCAVHLFLPTPLALHPPLSLFYSITFCCFYFQYLLWQFFGGKKERNDKTKDHKNQLISVVCMEMLVYYSSKEKV